MTIKFLSEQAFNTGHTYLFGNNYIFDTYKDERVLKFFYPSAFNNSKDMLKVIGVVEGIDFVVGIESQERTSEKEL